jgi:hypothetical protein
MSFMIRALAFAVGLSLALPAWAEPPTGVAYTQTVVSLTATVEATIIAANVGRHGLCLQNIGTSRVSLNIGATAVQDSGWAIQGSGVAGDQGGSYCWDAGVVPIGAIHGIAAGNTKIVVWEGR